MKNEAEPKGQRRTERVGERRKKSRAPSAQAGEVRIIAGTWRSRRIAFPSIPGLRPTPDRVRETLFNWLGQDLSGFRCLDLYSGSGALGFEALSRGAERVLMVERDPVAFCALEANARLLAANGAQLLQGDALEFLAAQKKAKVGTEAAAGLAPRFDVVFLDPPFGTGLPDGLLDLLPSLLASGGCVYVESGQALNLPPPWTTEKRGRAGQVHFQLARLETT